MKVPVQDGFQVMPAIAPAGQLATPRMENVAARQAELLGRSMQGGGVQMSRMAMHMQEEANQLRLDEAQIRAREALARLTYDPESGYQSIKGRNALDRPDGKSLWDEYGERFDAELQAIAGGLGNDIQRQRFAATAARLRAGLTGSIQHHVLSEKRTTQIQTNQSIIDNQVEIAIQGYRDDSAIQSAIHGQVDDEGEVLQKGIVQAVAELARLNGWDEPTHLQQRRKAVSQAHAGVASRLLDDDPAEANRYLNAHQADMTAGDVDRLNRSIRPALARSEGLKLGEAIFSEGSLLPTSFDDAVSMVLKFEGGYTRDDAGRGETNYGINKTANPDVDIRNLTPDKAAALYKERYWNAIGADNLPPAIRMIAFDTAVNMGPSAANKLIAASGGDPARLLNLREERYAQLASKEPSRFGENVQQAWANRIATLRQHLANSENGTFSSLTGMLDRADLIADEDQKRVAKQHIKELYSFEQARKKEEYDALFLRVQEIAYAKPGGWKDIAPADWGRLTHEDRAKLQGGVPKESSPDILLLLENRPDLWVSGKIEQFRYQLSEADYRRYFTQGNGPGADQKIRKASYDATVFNRGLVNAGLEKLTKSRLSDRERDQKLELTMAFKREIEAQQQAKGRALSLEEQETLLARLLKPVKVKAIYTNLGGLLRQDSSMEKHVYEVQSPGNILIPDKARKLISARARAAGIANLSEQEMLNAYLAMEEE
ncbi:glycosyl hydrolase 108 family protein [Laribacter hongkongensis]|uniref:glycosyl hydrolase 108 family protein n=1 Tax=Laribacter hongkongensis TaxID=168471 RepID=UPI001EFE9A64|nr:glycosyl hydrolase 108 family protein [Laribacter hongkongensis]MCG9093745.1 hypothetical protein [Laribacter hongkongensis]